MNDFSSYFLFVLRETMGFRTIPYVELIARQSHSILPKRKCGMHLYQNAPHHAQLIEITCPSLSIYGPATPFVPGIGLGVGKV